MKNKNTDKTDKINQHGFLILNGTSLSRENDLEFYF